MNILVVDDNDSVLTVLRVALESKGHSVWLATDGTEALKVLQQTDMHAVISDILMPRMDGYQLCLEVRKSERFGNIPFIFHSSTYTSPSDELMAINVGADKFLKKPANVVDVFQALEETLAKPMHKNRMGAPPEEFGLMMEYNARLVSKLESKNIELEAQSHALRQSEEQANKSREQLRALTARLQAAREEERIQIAREVHDDLGELLTGFKLGLAWIGDQITNVPAFSNHQEVMERIAALGLLADSTTKRVRKLCTELRPAVLDDLGLVAAFEWHISEFQKHTNIRCKTTVKEKTLTMGAEQATAIFRIFQEILTNIARHSQASKVRVLLQTDETKFMLEVRDNGRGIQPEQMAGTGSLGLLGMRERALGVGGKLDIQGQKGRGTTVTLTIPAQAPAARS